MSFLSNICLLVSCAFVLVSAERWVSIETQPEVATPGWQLEGLAPESEPLALFIALKHHNLDEFFRIFKEVSDPEHENYGGIPQRLFTG